MPHPATPPVFEMGQRVRSRIGTPRIGWIRYSVWHYKLGCYFYWIEVAGKNVARRKVTRRYLAEDLQPEPE